MVRGRLTGAIGTDYVFATLPAAMASPLEQVQWTAPSRRAIVLHARMSTGRPPRFGSDDAGPDE